jgi:hypothetical protein
VTTSSTASAPLTTTRNTFCHPSVRPLALSPAPMEPVLLPCTGAANARGAHAIVLRKTRQTHSNERSVGADGYISMTSTRRYAQPSRLYAPPGPLNSNCQHVASNKYTRYRPYPTPVQFTASQDLISRMTVFLRRELLVWPNADVEVCLLPCIVCPRVPTSTCSSWSPS